MKTNGTERTKQSQVRMTDDFMARIHQYQNKLRSERDVRVSFSEAVRALIERGLKRARRGLPKSAKRPTDGKPTKQNQIRMTDAFKARIGEHQSEEVNFSEAARTLIELGLKAAGL